jgi:hypothetical protein
VPQLRRALDDRPDVGHGERHVPQLRRLDAVADLNDSNQGWPAPPGTNRLFGTHTVLNDRFDAKLKRSGRPCCCS